jgi:hypothetical protein
MLSTEQQTELRYAVRRYLAARPTAALALDTIRHALIHKGHEATPEDVVAELTYWVLLPTPHVTRHRLPHSTEWTWQITSIGRLADANGE